MSTAWVPPHPTYHLRVFALSLGVMVLCLVGLLFGVTMEAVAPATGIITARDLREVRARQAGLVEPGWYEGEATRPGQPPLAVRMDADGNGQSAPVPGKSWPVRRHQLIDDKGNTSVQGRRFHRLQAGDALWPGQLLARVRNQDQELQLEQIEDRIKQTEQDSELLPQLERERGRLRAGLEQGILRAPMEAECWLAVEVRVWPHEKADAGDVLATIVPADPITLQPRHLIARLDVDEKHWGAVAVGQLVRLQSTVHNSRLHGKAEARIERLEPWGEPAPHGGRQFHALAAITQAPFVLPLGSSFLAEIVVGRKPVYRIILEH